ncbi:flagellar hook-basal body complex protein FliE [Tatumella terrea]|uniref:flagellar hook-basal body complex protein FliE n=1 Tax=Tatumella terrea TaxID=419007 RepID=UPI0031E49598
MNSLLQQIDRGITPVSAGTERLSGVDTQAGEFSGILHRALNNLSERYQKAQNKAEAFEAGIPDVSLNDVMIDQQKAALSLQMGVQVRNKLVSAYTDIMNMSV